MVMVPKPCLCILGGILCEPWECVKGRKTILPIWVLLQNEWNENH